MDPPLGFLTSSWILEIYQKRAKLTFLDDKDVEHDITQSTFCTFVTYKGEKIHIFTLKWLDHLLLMTFYLVTIVTDSHQTCTATENGNHLRKIQEKPYGVTSRNHSNRFSRNLCQNVCKRYSYSY